jgi:hypothetical protein
MIKDRTLIARALTKWIDNHPEEKRGEQYLTRHNGQSYTLNQIKAEIENDTEFGEILLSDIVTLTIDLLARGQKKF